MAHSAQNSISVKRKPFFTWLCLTQKGNRVLLLILLLLVAGFVCYASIWGVHFGACYFHEATGLNCISCGATRATLCLLHYDLAGAVYYNPFILLFYVGFCAWYGFCVLNAFRKPAKYHPPFDIPAAIPFCFLAAAVLFGIARNIPVYQLYFY